MSTLLAQRRPGEHAFERLYEAHVQDVHRFALMMLRNRADAEDLVQTTFMKAYRRLRSRRAAATPAEVADHDRAQRPPDPRARREAPSAGGRRSTRSSPMSRPSDRTRTSTSERSSTHSTRSRSTNARARDARARGALLRRDRGGARALELGRRDVALPRPAGDPGAARGPAHLRRGGARTQSRPRRTAACGGARSAARAPTRVQRVRDAGAQAACATRGAAEPRPAAAPALPSRRGVEEPRPASGSARKRQPWSPRVRSQSAVRTRSRKSSVNRRRSPLVKRSWRSSARSRRRRREGWRPACLRTPARRLAQCPPAGPSRSRARLSRPLAAATPTPASAAPAGASVTPTAGAAPGPARVDQVPLPVSPPQLPLPLQAPQLPPLGAPAAPQVPPVQLPAAAGAASGAAASGAAAAAAAGSGTAAAAESPLKAVSGGFVVALETFVRARHGQRWTCPRPHPGSVPSAGPRSFRETPRTGRFARRTSGVPPPRCRSSIAATRSSAGSPGRSPSRWQNRRHARRSTAGVRAG